MGGYTWVIEQFLTKWHSLIQRTAATAVTARGGCPDDVEDCVQEIRMHLIAKYGYIDFSHPSHESLIKRIIRQGVGNWQRQCGTVIEISHEPTMDEIGNIITDLSTDTHPEDAVIFRAILTELPTTDYECRVFCKRHDIEMDELAEYKARLRKRYNGET